MTNELSRATVLKMVQDENQKLKEELEQFRAQASLYRAYVRALYELYLVRAQIKTENELLSFLAQVLECAIYGTHAKDGSLLLVDSDGDELVFVHVRGSVSATLPGYRIKRNEGISGWVAEHNIAQIVNDPYSDPRFLARVDDHFQFKTCNLAAVPIAGTQRALGVMELLNKMDGRAFTAHDVEMISVLACLCAPAIEQFESATNARGV